MKSLRLRSPHGFIQFHNITEKNIMVKYIAYIVYRSTKTKNTFLNPRRGPRWKICMITSSKIKTGHNCKYSQSVKYTNHSCHPQSVIELSTF